MNPGLTVPNRKRPRRSRMSSGGYIALYLGSPSTVSSKTPRFSALFRNDACELIGFDRGA